MGTCAWNMLIPKFRSQIPRPAPPTGRPGRAQSGRTQEFGYEPFKSALKQQQQQQLQTVKIGLNVLVDYEEKFLNNNFVLLQIFIKNCFSRFCKM